MIAEVESHERDARLHEASGQERLLTPEVLSIPLADLSRLTREIERVLSPPSQQEVGRLLLVAVEGLHRAPRIEVGPQAIKAPQQIAPAMNAVGIDAVGQAKQVSSAASPRVDSHVGVNGQAGRRVGDERIEFLAEPAAPGDVRTGLHKSLQYEKRHRSGWIRAAQELGNHRGDCGVFTSPLRLILGSASRLPV